MTTLNLFATKNLSIPSSTSWYLADLGEFRGKQAFYTQLLKVPICDIVSDKIKAT